MEKGNNLSRSRVGNDGSVLLSLIATAAGESKVAQFAHSAEMTWLDVVYGKPTGVELFRVATILADTACLLDDLCANRLGDDRHGD